MSDVFQVVPLLNLFLLKPLLLAVFLIQAAFFHFLKK